MCGYTTDEVIGRTPKILQGEGTEEGQLSALMEAVNEREVSEAGLDGLELKSSRHTFSPHGPPLPAAPTTSLLLPSPPPHHPKAPPSHRPTAPPPHHFMTLSGQEREPHEL